MGLRCTLRKDTTPLDESMRYTVKRPNRKEKLLWGYDTPLSGTTFMKDTVPLDEFIRFITDPTIINSSPGAIKNVLIYWDRGIDDRGEEAKMIEMGDGACLQCCRHEA